ncbi:hypothetical protein BpHYR1_005457 [Brachionus plicatilis]|uniref:Uncharacterized protein n=1 Tax=Brachionus plicatilis TaxID=10195 RepID=A0A3M7S377_BRAPC|nr:hypothetical protein BpHYR1_005457 [Brachionus plicatilis]
MKYPSLSVRSSRLLDRFELIIFELFYKNNQCGSFIILLMFLLSVILVQLVKDLKFIINNDLQFAYKWNKMSKPFQHINDVYMVKSNKKSDFTRNEGEQYLSILESKTWTTLDEMIFSLNSIRIVQVNRENWKLNREACKITTNLNHNLNFFYRGLSDNSFKAESFQINCFICVMNN